MNKHKITRFRNVISVQGRTKCMEGQNSANQEYLDCQSEDEVHEHGDNSGHWTFFLSFFLGWRIPNLITGLSGY